MKRAVKTVLPIAISGAVDKVAHIADQLFPLYSDKGDCLALPGFLVHG
jgi:hypothetical protein